MWLSIDQGGHASRALVFDAGGEVAASAEVPVATCREGLRVEHDAAELVGSVARALESVGQQLGARVWEIEAAGIATQRSSLVCARRSTGSILTPVLSWQDRRGLDDIRGFARASERIKALTGLRLSPHYGVSKLRWCLAHDEPTRAALAEHDLVMAPLATLLLHRFADGDAWRVDPANASRTLLLDYRRLEWSAELERLFGVPPGVLPELTGSRFDYGAVRCGNAQVPLEVVMGDQPAALYAAGEPEPGTAFVVIGTGAFIQIVTGAEPVTDTALLTSIAWADADLRRYVVEGTVNGAGAAVAELLVQLRFEVPPAPAVLAAAFCESAQSPLFLNGIAGLGSPDWRPDFASRFVGTGSALQRLAAVYESIVFLVVRNLERMRMRVAVDGITLGGGIARFDFMAQALASLSGLPVKRWAQTEATARGLAVAMSRGRLPPARRPGHDRLFEPCAAELLRRRYERWSRALDAALGDGA